MIKFKKGDIVPQEIITRSNEDYNKVKFLVDVIIDEDTKTIYPEKVINKEQSIIFISKTLSIIPISVNYELSLLPIAFKEPKFMDITFKYGLLNLGG